MGNGFIQDKLEIKFLILYVMASFSELIPVEGIQKMTMIDDGIDYFDFTECLKDMVETENLTRSDDELYAITAKGIRNNEICKSSLPYSVLLRADREIEAYQKERERLAGISGRYHRRNDGAYVVELAMEQNGENYLNMSIVVPNESVARNLRSSFLRSPEVFYTDLIEKK